MGLWDPILPLSFLSLMSNSFLNCIITLSHRMHVGFFEQLILSAEFRACAQEIRIKKIKKERPHSSVNYFGVVPMFI
ncbi:hypothetical protein CA600_24940 [Paenibacillus sp. VTT E-133280]|nr:hypothetical protein CA600_24940 [Paenibacillus sp. VTT E-133280]